MQSWSTNIATMGHLYKQSSKQESVSKLCDRSPLKVVALRSSASNSAGKRAAMHILRAQLAHLVIAQSIMFEIVRVLVPHIWEMSQRIVPSALATTKIRTLKTKHQPQPLHLTRLPRTILPEILQFLLSTIRFLPNSVVCPKKLAVRCPRTPCPSRDRTALHLYRAIMP